MKNIKVKGQMVQTGERQTDGYMDATKRIISPPTWSINISTNFNQPTNQQTNQSTNQSIWQQYLS